MKVNNYKKIYYSKYTKGKYVNAIITICLIIMLFPISITYAHWNTITQKANQRQSSIMIGMFDKLYSFDCKYADIVINQQFKDKYMQLDDNGNYIWKQNGNGNITYRAEINSLTPYGTIIKSDYCYMVSITNYSLIDTGIPNINNKNNWLNLIPLTINYIPNFWYGKNHIVKTQDNNYFMAKWETNTNPNIDRTVWNKIEPVMNNNFFALERFPNFIDYSKPILYTITPSLIWDQYTTYDTGNTAQYQNQNYVSIAKSSGVIPPQNPWAWRLF